jgi:glycerol-3-phosphate O-acyltransferase/dihydroxyacetone phosphate acyltransferase
VKIIYWYLGLIMRICIRIFFRHIHVSGYRKVPLNKPVILAANHPGAFLDPVIICSIIRKPVHFIVRGDVFKKPLAKWFFTQLNMIPVFRIDEGFENVSRNSVSIKAAAEVLKKNGIVLVFCENYSSIHRRIRGVRKGTARIAMEVSKACNTDVQIIATGLSYEYKTNLRREMFLDFSDPLRSMDYLDEYNIHPQYAYASITRDIEKKLAEGFIMIRNPECDMVAELHMEYHRNMRKLSVFPVVVYSRARLENEKEVCDKIDTLFETDKAAFNRLESDTSNYQKALDQHAISDRALISKPLNIFQYLLMLAGVPLFIAGFIFLGLPYYLCTRIADKKVTRVDFYDSVAMNGAGVLFAILTLIWNLALISSLGWYSVLVWPIAFISSEAGALMMDAFKINNEVRKARSLPVYEALLKQRKELMRMV